VIRSARFTRRATQQTDAAADQLLDWLRSQRGAVPDQAHGAPEKSEPSEGAGPSATPNVEAALGEVEIVPAPPAAGTPYAAAVDARPVAAGEHPPASRALLLLPHPDWLHHRLVVTGATAAIADFQANACGAGAIPWTLDLDRVEEDLFHLLLAPPAPQRRRLSLAGARVLAGQLRDAVRLRHDAATARVGSSRACPFDLYALVPVPADILRLGPDHPDALAWLWTHWGTTDALRHVAIEPAPALRTPLPAGTATVQLTFWSADWTPWRALAAAAARRPALRFDVRPTYGVL